MDNTVYGDELPRQDTWQICFKELIEAIITTGSKNHQPLHSQREHFPNSANHVRLSENLNMPLFHLLDSFLSRSPFPHWWNGAALNKCATLPSFTLHLTSIKEGLNVANPLCFITLLIQRIGGEAWLTQLGYPQLYMVKSVVSLGVLTSILSDCHNFLNNQGWTCPDLSRDVYWYINKITKK